MGTDMENQVDTRILWGLRGIMYEDSDCRLLVLFWYGVLQIDLKRILALFEDNPCKPIYERSVHFILQFVPHLILNPKPITLRLSKMRQR